MYKIFFWCVIWRLSLTISSHQLVAYLGISSNDAPNFLVTLREIAAVMNKQPDNNHYDQKDIFNTKNQLTESKLDVLKKTDSTRKTTDQKSSFVGIFLFVISWFFAILFVTAAKEFANSIFNRCRGK